jgi:hypothetical protein
MNSIAYHMPHLKNHIIVLFLSFYVTACFAMEVPIDDFPIVAYSQNANDYLSPEGEDYSKSLLSAEYLNQQLKQFYNHYYASDAEGLSPWSEQLVMSALPLVGKIEVEILDEFNNQNKSYADKHYAENFKEHDRAWWGRIKDNMDLDSLALGVFRAENRAIAIANTHARALPDGAPDFFHATLPGQGFPFDNLQESAIWTGTPLYVFSVSKDKAWSFVLTPDGYFAWVKSNDIAYVSPAFMNRWQKAVQRGLVAVTQTEASVMDDQLQFQFTGYIGSVFPVVSRNNEQTAILIPVKNSHNQAMIKTGVIGSDASSIMPLVATPSNMVKILNQLKNRPYGWGGAFFFNDCSQEIKSIFTPFGIWLPRNSGQQAKLGSGLDLSKKDVDERISLLKAKGHPLMTIIYINGHVMLYIGNNKARAMTYQNIWGVSPVSRDKRYVIGQSLFFPLLKRYPENPDVASLAGGPNFKLVFLDELNVKAGTPLGFATGLLGRSNVLN